MPTLAASGVALQVVVLALVMGLPLGMVSGYLGGWVDRLLVLLMDTLYTLPVLPEAELQASSQQIPERRADRLSAVQTILLE